MKSLLVALGLSDTAAEHTALTAVTALQGQAASLQAQLAAAQAAAFDTSKHVLMADYAKLTSDYTALSAQVAQGEKSALVETLVKDGKLTAGQKDWALSTDLAGLKAFAASAVANPALAGGTQSGNAGASNASAGAHGLSADELAVCSAAGFKPEDFAKNKGDFASPLCRFGKSHAKARVIITPPQAAIAVKTVPQVRSIATIDGCQSFRIA